MFESNLEELTTEANINPVQETIITSSPPITAPITTPKEESSESSESSEGGNYYIKTLKSCCRTPLLYVTVIPLLVILLLFYLKPEYMYDIGTDEEGKSTKKLNLKKTAIILLGVTVMINAIVYYYVIQHWGYKI